MTKDDIIRMALEAMAHTSIKPNDKVVFYISYENGIDEDGFCDSVETFIERFSALVAESEREACAKIADLNLCNMQFLASNPPKSAAAYDIAIAIRARDINVPC